jgi:hypothetical protein
VDWEGDLKSDMQRWLTEARPGTKFYVIYTVGFRYKTPPGQLENKWDPLREQWVPRVSTGLLGFEYLTPCATATFELK